MKLFYDFHLHSCLSPCGDKDMTPYNMVNMAKLLGLDIIALTDHNSCRNCRGAIRAGKAAGITVIPGMELCTSEEVHTVCLFRELEAAERFSEYVKSTMPPVKNRPDIFGEQLVMDNEDGILGEEDILLTLASSISVHSVVEKTAEYGGVCYPAHIDRSSYSVISNLGMITDDMHFSAVEFADKNNFEKYKELYPIIKDAKIFRGSDAHYLENMREADEFLELPECSAGAVIDYINALPQIK